MLFFTLSGKRYPFSIAFELLFPGTSYSLVTLIPPPEDMVLENSQVLDFWFRGLHFSTDACDPLKHLESASQIFSERWDFCKWKEGSKMKKQDANFKVQLNSNFKMKSGNLADN